jgi:hypothetical protein
MSMNARCNHVSEKPEAKGLRLTSCHSRKTLNVGRKGIVKLTAERKHPFHSAGLSSGFEALRFHSGVKNGLQMTSTFHLTILLCRFNR